jgi:hypothetical protein
MDFAESCNALILIGFLLGLLKLWFIRYMDIHAYLLMPMASIVTIGMLVTYISIHWVSYGHRWLHWRIIEFDSTVSRLKTLI